MKGFRRKRGGGLLIEVLVAFFLLFVVSLAICNLLRYSAQSQNLAVSQALALHLAEEGLEKARGGEIELKLGHQELPQQSLQIGAGAQVFSPAVEIEEREDLLLVRSQVDWDSSHQHHRIEVKAYVPAS